MTLLTTVRLEDILRARLRTLGVEEHRLTMETGVYFRDWFLHSFAYTWSAAEKGADWVFYDIGGARSQRVAWASYFEDVNAVIFLAPMSGFNECLEEDSKVNRLVCVIFMGDRSVLVDRVLL